MNPTIKVFFQNLRYLEVYYDNMTPRAGLFTTEHIV